MKRLSFIFVAILIFSSNAYTADIASDVRSGSSGPDNSNGGYLELGISFNSLHLGGSADVADFGGEDNVKNSLGLVLAGAYRFRGFFLEAAHQSGDGLNLGYNVWSNNRWAVDLLAASANGIKLGSGNSGFVGSDATDAQREQAVHDRDRYYNGAGVRVTGYFGNAIFQYRLVSDIHRGNGLTSSARLGYSRQLKNWNFHSVLSANYASKKTSQYRFGVTDEEASERYPQYDIGSTIEYAAEVGVTYPLSEKVVFRSTARFTLFDDDIAKSPIQDGEYGIRMNNSISYVF